MLHGGGCREATTTPVCARQCASTGIGSDLPACIHPRRGGCCCCLHLSASGVIVALVNDPRGRMGGSSASHPPPPSDPVEWGSFAPTTGALSRLPPMLVASLRSAGTVAVPGTVDVCAVKRGGVSREPRRRWAIAVTWDTRPPSARPPPAVDVWCASTGGGWRGRERRGRGRSSGPEGGAPRPADSGESSWASGLQRQTTAPTARRRRRLGDHSPPGGRATRICQRRWFALSLVPLLGETPFRAYRSAAGARGYKSYPPGGRQR